MPTVNVDVNTLFKLMGKSLTDSEFEDLCFDFGIELEEVTTAADIGKVGNDKVYKIDIPANRYDMLCVEGIAGALQVYLGLAAVPKYHVSKPAERILVENTTSKVRPFVVGAILRNIVFDQARYNGFIDLQDKLHNNICRKRTLVAIGTHDLDTIEGPFTYKAMKPQDIQFIALNQTKSMNANELFSQLEHDKKLSKFLDIIRNEPLYPVIYDSQDRVLSLPPIINGNHSKITLDTKNVFIECTATDITKAGIVLNMMVTMFSRYCSTPYQVEPLEICYTDRTEYYPNLNEKEMAAKVDYINSCVGINVTAQEQMDLLRKMSLNCSISGDGNELKVKIPPTRADILHACDIMEDAAIAYNINKIVKTVPSANCTAVPLPLNKLADALRKELSFSGYTEVLSFTLCSINENFKFLNRKNENQAVTLSNPKTVEYQIVRTSLLPGILKTISANKHHPLPIRIFEVSDVVFRDETLERRARNQRNCSALYAGKSSGLEEIHGLVDRMMAMLSVKDYHIKESSNPTYFPGRCADILCGEQIVGSFGILHPQVLENFDIHFPCSSFEFNIEPFL